MKINITKITPSKAKNGSDYMLFETNEGKMACWDTELFPHLHSGWNDVEVLQKGDFKNIVSVNQMGAGAVNPSQSGPPQSDFKIVREVALKCACEVVPKIFVPPESITVEVILKYAEGFEEWINRQT